LSSETPLNVALPLLSVTTGLAVTASVEPPGFAPIDNVMLCPATGLAPASCACTVNGSGCFAVLLLLAPGCSENVKLLAAPAVMLKFELLAAVSAPSVAPRW